MVALAHFVRFACNCSSVSPGKVQGVPRVVALGGFFHRYTSPCFLSSLRTCAPRVSGTPLGGTPHAGITRSVFRASSSMTASFPAPVGSASFPRSFGSVARAVHRFTIVNSLALSRLAKCYLADALVVAFGRRRRRVQHADQDSQLSPCSAAFCSCGSTCNGTHPLRAESVDASVVRVDAVDPLFGRLVPSMWDSSTVSERVIGVTLRHWGHAGQELGPWPDSHWGHARLILFFQTVPHVTVNVGSSLPAGKILGERRRNRGRSPSFRFRFWRGARQCHVALVFRVTCHGLLWADPSFRWYVASSIRVG